MKIVCYKENPYEPGTLDILEGMQFAKVENGCIGFTPTSRDATRFTQTEAKRMERRGWQSMLAPN